MKSKFTEQVVQKLKVSRNEWKNSDLKIKQEFILYQNPPKKSRENLKQKLEDNIHKVQIFMCDICDKNIEQNVPYIFILHHFIMEKHSNVKLVHQFL